MIEKPNEGTQYDKIAADYARLILERPLNEFGVYPSLLEAAGNISGKDVLDLACGSGTVAEMVRVGGARRIVGVDDSPGMLRIAKSKNRKQHLGIEYILGHVGSLGKVGDFDILTGGWLLHYAFTKVELSAMCRDIATNLKSGGVFVAVNNNPLNPLSDNPKYNVLTVPIGQFEEGCELEVTYSIDETKVSFRQHYWKLETYEKALRDAGLVDIEWLPVKPTQEGVAIMGKDFWSEFLANPNIVAIRARKP